MLMDKKFKPIEDESILEGISGGAASPGIEPETTLSCSCGKTFTGPPRIAQKMLDTHRINCKGI